MNPAPQANRHGTTIWIDLDNTPHVPFFKPIVRELEKRGHRVVLTARDAFQVCELAAQAGLNCRRVGRHYGKNRFKKACGLGWRALQLLPVALRARPHLALSHGSRSQILLANLWRIPTVMIMDYEFAETPWLLRPRWEIVPAALQRAHLHCQIRERIRTYPGLKEDVYAAEFRPDPSLGRRLGLDPDAVVVTVRPPASEAHYHNPESDRFFIEFMNHLCATPHTQAVLLPRNKAQEADLRQGWPQWFTGAKVVVPQEAVDGLNLLWHSDLVVSGGGTMNREAAALGIPVYSIFRGRIGALDRQLHADGRMVLVESIEDVRRKIRLERRPRLESQSAPRPRQALQEILNHIEAILGSEGAPAPASRSVPQPVS